MELTMEDCSSEQELSPRRGVDIHSLNATDFKEIEMQDWCHPTVVCFIERRAARGNQLHDICVAGATGIVKGSPAFDYVDRPVGAKFNRQHLLFVHDRRDTNHVFGAVSKTSGWARMSFTTATFPVRMATSRG